MKRSLAVALSFTMAVCGYGCSGDNTLIGEEAEGAGAPADSVPASIETLVELTVEHQTISFVRWGEGQDAHLVLRMSGSSDTGSVVDALRAKTGELTLLEIYQAFAPTGQAAPLELVEAHAEQAFALGVDREPMTIDAPSINAVVEKAIDPPPGVNPCEPSLTFPAPFVWTSKHVTVKLGGNAYLCTGDPIQQGSIPTSSSCTHYFTSRQRVGACKAGAGSSIIASAGFGALGGVWSTTPNESVAPGQYMWWEYLPSAIQRRLAVIVSSAANNAFGYRSGVGG